MMSTSGWLDHLVVSRHNQTVENSGMEVGSLNYFGLKLGMENLVVGINGSLNGKQWNI